MEYTNQSGIIVKKSGWVLSDFEEQEQTSKGGGPAGGGGRGGGWRPSPNKHQDGRFVGKPGEINTYIKPNGEKFETKIGPKW